MLKIFQLFAHDVDAADKNIFGRVGVGIPKSNLEVGGPNALKRFMLNVNMLKLN